MIDDNVSRESPSPQTGKENGHFFLCLSHDHIREGHVQVLELLVVGGRLQDPRHQQAELLNILRDFQVDGCGGRRKGWAKEAKKKVSTHRRVRAFAAEAVAHSLGDALGDIQHFSRQQRGSTEEEVEKEVKNEVHFLTGRFTVLRVRVR